MSRIPTMTRKMLLEGPDDLPDGAGGMSRSWVILGTKWVEVRPGTGRLSDIGEMPVSQSRARIILRASAPGSASRPKPDQRFREGTRVYLIDAVTDFDADARYLVCHVREEFVQ